MAIQLPNNKISRTLPEQVGFNSAKIEEIIKFLNESGLKDLVISVDAASGTLTPEQLAIAELSPSYVLYGGKVYVKALEDLTNIDYFQVGVNISGSTEYQASIERVRVVRDTRAYAAETINLFESYTSDQIDTLLSGLESVYAKLSGASFTGPITAPSIIEDMTGYSVSETHSSQITRDYIGICKNGNKLTISVAGNIQTGESGITSGTVLQVAYFTIPASVHQKLVPFYSDFVDVRKVYCFQDIFGGINMDSYVSKTSSNTLSIRFYAPAMTANKKYYFRYELTFLLGENYAE